MTDSPPRSLHSLGRGERGPAELLVCRERVPADVLTRRGARASQTRSRSDSRTAAASAAADNHKVWTVSIQDVDMPTFTITKNHVVLSRVRTRAGLFLGKKLDLNKKFSVLEKLSKFEERMKENEGQYIKQLHGIGDDMQTD